MNQEQIDKLIMQFIGNSISDEDFILLKKWLKEDENRDYFDSFLKINYLLNIDVPFNQDASLEEIKSKINSNSKINNSRFYIKYGIAASILLLISAGVWFTKFGKNTSEQINVPVIVDDQIKPGTDKATLTLEDGIQIVLEKGKSFKTANANSNGKEITYKADKGKTRKIAYNYLAIPRGGEYFVNLADGTRVWLNSESKLKYPKAFMDGEDRVVELLYGEAYFDVSSSTNHSGTKFKVVHQSQEIEVLGTEFNVKAYRDESSIFTTLVEGAIAVDNYKTVQNLTPNQQSILNTETKEVKIQFVNVDSETSWRRRVFSFEDKPLKDVMRVISRWYDVDVIFINKELESINFNGNLKKDISIERILSLMLSNKLNSYQIKDKTIIFK